MSNSNFTYVKIPLDLFLTLLPSDKPPKEALRVIQSFLNEDIPEQQIYLVRKWLRQVVITPDNTEIIKSCWKIIYEYEPQNLRELRQYA